MPSRAEQACPLRRRPRAGRTASARSSSTPTASTSGSGTTRRTTRLGSSTASTRRTACSTCVFQRAHEQPLASLSTEPGIVDRMYQLEGDQARHRALHREAPQGADRPGHRHRQDPRGHRARRPARCAPAGPSGSSSCATGGSSASRPSDAFKEFTPRTRRVIVRDSTAKDREHADLPRHLPGDDEDLRDLRRRLLRPDHRRRVAPQHLQRLRRLFQLLRRLQVGLTATPVEIRRAQHLQPLRLRGQRPDLQLPLRGGDRSEPLSRPVRGLHPHDASSSARASAVQR